MQQRRNSLAGGHTIVLSSRALNEFRFQWAPDLRLSKSFQMGPGRKKVDVIGQIFNLLGTDNLLASGGGGAWVDNALSNSFGRILTAQNRQQGEIVIRFAW